MTLRDDLSMADAKKISAAGQVYDSRFKQWRDDAFESLGAMVEIVVEEWTIVPPVPPTADGFFSLPITLGNLIGPALTDHIKAIGLSEEVLGSESGS